MIEQHYSCRQLAAKLGVSHGTVHKFVTEGRIGHVSFGHRLLIPESAILQYLETHRLGPAPTRRLTRPSVAA
jgi:excisionase family DNA binding protein